MEIDWQYVLDAAFNRIATGEQTTVGSAGADRYHPFRVGHGAVGTQQSYAHVLGDRAAHRQHVGVARRCDEAQTEAFEIVESITQRVQFELAAVAGASVDVANRKRAAEPGAGGAVNTSRQLGEAGLIRRGR